MPASQNKKARRLTGILTILVTGMAGAFVGVSIGEQFVDRFNFDPPNLYVAIPGVVICAFLAVFMHELGHVIGGKIAGFRFILMIVGPFKWIREKKGIAFRWNTSFQMGGGLALLLPEQGRPLRRQLGWYIAGGPLMNMVLASAFIVSAWWLSQHPESSLAIPHTGFFVLLSALLHGGIMLVTLIPFPTRGLDNDGTKLLDLLRGGQRAETNLLIHALTASSISGVRPRDWNRAHLEQLLQLGGDLAEKHVLYAHLMAYYHYLDQGDATQAGEALSAILPEIENVSELIQPSFWLELAFFDARYLQNPTQARARFERASGGFVEKHTRARVESAVLLSEGEPVQAKQIAEQGLEWLARSMDRGGAKAERDWLTDLIEEANVRRPASRMDS